MEQQPEFWYWATKSVVRPLMSTAFRLRFEGSEHIPQTGGLIVACNHISRLDPLAQGLLVDGAGRKARFLAKAELFHAFGLGRIMRGMRQIPVHRGTAGAPLALDEAIAALERGDAVMIYPEGTITTNADLSVMAGKMGVARLALATGAPVIPCAVWGSHVAAPKGHKRSWRPGLEIVVKLGPAVNLSDFEGPEPTHETLRTATAQIMAELGELVEEIRQSWRRPAWAPAWPEVDGWRPSSEDKQLSPT
ncbi:MAG: lysophospholipid acyltransferase family protein [Actinomycetota bacterium]